MGRAITGIFILFILYIYLHNPVLVFTGGIGSLKLLYPLFLGYAFMRINTVYHFFKNYKIEWYYFIAILLFVILRTVVGGDVTYVRTTMVAIVEAFIIPIILLHFFATSKLKSDDFIKLLLITGAVSSLISLACIASPALNMWTKEIMVQDEYLQENIFRGFGISDGLTYAYGIIQGTIFSIGLFHIKKHKWFSLFLPIVLISIAFNARTGLLVAAVGVIVFVIFHAKSFKSLFPLLVLLPLGYFVLINMGNYISFEEDSLEFVFNFFDQAKDIVSSGDTSAGVTTDILFNEMIVFPTDFVEWILGTGKSVFLSQENSDIGFILQLNYGGIVYIILLTLLMWRILKTVRYEKKYFYLFVFTFLIANTKGDFIINSGGFRLVILMCFYFKWNNKRLAYKEI